MADANPSKIPENFDERTDDEKKREQERKEASKRLDDKNKVKTNEQDIIDTWENVSKKDDWSNEQKLAYMNYKQQVGDALKKEKDSLLKQGQEAVQEGFDPYINRAWKAPDYDEEKARLSEQYKDIQSRKKAQAQKREDAKKAAREKLKQEQEAFKNGAREALKAKQIGKIQKNIDKNTEKSRGYEQKSIEAEDKEQGLSADIFEQLAKATGVKASTLRDKMTQVDKTLPSFSKASPSTLKQYAEIGKGLIAEEKAALDALEKDPAFKAEEDSINAARKAYWKGVSELNKKQAPYSIRNAFLIIDLIQKSLQNIGRALPKGDLNPAYTQTPFEEPELYKLWRTQIEKGQELKEKQLEGYIDILKGNLGTLGYDKQFINDFIRTKQGLINDWYKAGLDREQTKAMLNFEIDLGKNLNDLDEESKDFLRTAQLYMAKDMNEALSIVLKDYMIKNPESVNGLMNSLQGLLDSGINITSELGNLINVLLNGFETQIKRINEIGFNSWLKELISGTSAALPGNSSKGKNPIISKVQEEADEINPLTVTNNKLSKGLRETMTDAVLRDTDLSDESRKSIFDKLSQENVDMDDIINNNFYGSKKLKEAMGKFVADQVKLRTNSMGMNSSLVKMDKYIENMSKAINRNNAKDARDNWLKYQAEVDKFNKDYTKERDLSSPFGKFMFWYGNNRQAVDAAYNLLMRNGYDINTLPEVAYIDGYGNVVKKPGKNDTAINPRELAYVLMTVGTGDTAENIIDNSKVSFLRNPSTGEAYTISELSDKFSRDDYLELTDEQRHFLGANANLPEFKDFIDYRPSIEESTDKIVDAIEGKVAARNASMRDKDARIAELEGLKDDADRAKEAAEKELAVEKRDKRIGQEISLVPDVTSSKQNAAIQTLIDNTDMTLEEATGVVSALGGGAAIGKDFLNDIGRLADAYALASVDPLAKGSPEAIFTKAQKILAKSHPHMAKYFKNMNNAKLESLVKMAKKGGKFAKKAFKVAGPAAVVLQTADLVDDMFNITGNIQQNIENGEFYKNLTQPGIGKSVIEAIHGDNADYIKSHVLSDNLLPYYSFRLTKYGPVAAIDTLGATKNKKGDTVYSPEVKDMATWKGTTNDGNINITRGLLGSILYNKTGKENKDTGMTITSGDILNSMNLSYLDPKKDKKVIEEIYRKPYLLPVAWDSDFKQLDNKERLKLLNALDTKYGEQQFKNYRYK